MFARQRQSLSIRSLVLGTPVNQSPEQPLQPVQCTERGNDLGAALNPSPGTGQIEGGTAFIHRTSIDMKKSTAVSPARIPRLSDVQKDTRRGTPQLVSKMPILPFQRPNNWPQLSNHIKSNLVSDQFQRLSSRQDLPALVSAASGDGFGSGDQTRGRSVGGGASGSGSESGSEAGSEAGSGAGSESESGAGSESESGCGFGLQSRHPSPVTRHPNSVTRTPSPESRHPSPATRHPSPVTHLRLPAAALILASVLPAAAAAETAVMLPPLQHHRMPLELRQRAHRTVIQTLGEQGFTVLDYDDAQMRMLGHDFSVCSEVACGHKVAEHAGSDVVALVTVWGTREGHPHSVAVSLIGTINGDALGAEETIHRGDVAGAARQAAMAAIHKRRVARLGVVNVSSSPDGAHVEVQGKAVGVTPMRYMLHEGRHDIVINHPDFKPFRQEVTVQRNKELRLVFDLEADGKPRVTQESHDMAIRPSSATLDPGDLQTPPPSVTAAPEIVETSEEQTKTEGHWANWVVAGGLLAVSAAPLIPAFATLADDGKCKTLVAGSTACRERVSFGAQSAIRLGLGVAAIAGAVIFAVAQPIQVSVQANEQGAYLQARGRF